MFSFFFPRSVNWNVFEIIRSHVNSRNKCSDLPPSEPCAVVGLQLQQLPFVLGGLFSVYRNRPEHQDVRERFLPASFYFFLHPLNPYTIRKDTISYPFMHSHIGLSL